MIIRHAEKPSGESSIRGVTIQGSHDRHDLSVCGWQRAGALVRYFAPLCGTAAWGISTPRSIFASAAITTSPSLRAQHTVGPLAAELGLRVNTDYAVGDEGGLASAALQSPNPVLIAWHHNHIPPLVRAIAGAAPNCPEHWPDGRFDMVWILDHTVDGAWTFFQCMQRLLPHDIDQPV